MIFVTGSFVAKDGLLTEALRLSLEHVRRSRAENGCRSHAVHQDAENPSRLVFLEVWSDKAAIAATRQNPTAPPSLRWSLPAT